MTNLQQLTPLFEFPSNPHQLTNQQQCKTHLHHQQPDFHNKYSDLAAHLGVVNCSMYQLTLREVTNEEIQSHYKSKLTIFDILCQENYQLKVWSTTKIGICVQEKQIQIKKNLAKCLKIQEGPKLNFFVPRPQLSLQPNSDFQLKDIQGQENSSIVQQRNEICREKNTTKVAKRKRIDDSNNAHKKIITCLNKAMKIVQQSDLTISSIRMKKLSTEHLTLLQSLKSSRYGFITQLIYLQYMHGQQYLQKLYSVFSKQVLPKFIKQNRNMVQSKTREYLLKLPAFYIESFERFMKRRIQQATELIYKMDMKDRFKQNLYMKKGIQKVIKIRTELLSLA